MKNVIKGMVFICCVIWFLYAATIFSNTKHVYSDGAVIYTVNESFYIDQDKFKIKRIIKDQDEIFLEYVLFSKSNGWTFAPGAVNLSNLDADKGVLDNHGGSSSASFLLEKGCIQFEGELDFQKAINVQYKLFDREVGVTFNLDKEMVK